MIIHYIKVIFRSLIKDKGFTLVNILGLSVAILCCFLLVFWIKFETSYEKCYRNSSRVYKIVEQKEEIGELHYSTYIKDISKELKATFPQLEAVTYLYLYKTPISLNQEDDGLMMVVGETMDDFLRIFDYEYLEGSPQSVIKTRTAIITEETARKFWGNESPIGKKLLTYGGRIIGSDYTIGAVIKMPTNTQLKFDILKIGNAQINRGAHYIMLREGEEMTDILQKQIENFPSTLSDTKTHLYLQALDDVHLHSPKEITTNSSKEVFGNYGQILFFSVAVILILLMAIINYINTSIARSMGRIKEVGVRKVTGANKKQLIVRFLLESFIITIFTVFISIVITKYFFPLFSETMGYKIKLEFDFMTIALIVLITIVISVLAGGYTAFYLSSFKPALILRGGTKIGSKDTLRKVLLGIQFFISIAILISTVFIYRQIGAIFAENTGMNRSNIIIIDTGLWYQVEDFFEIIKAENPNIIDATNANFPPYNVPTNIQKIWWEGKNPSLDEVKIEMVYCDIHYGNTFGLEVVKGEFDPSGLGWYQSSEEHPANVVINESFAKLMEVENPIGVTVKFYNTTGKITGVVKDFNFKPMKEKSGPVFFFYNPELASNVYIKTTGQDKQKTLEYILAKYKEMKPDFAQRPVMYHTVADEYNVMYKDELRTLSMLSVFSIISFFLSLIGILSMVSFLIEKRSKEIAIRKINGAGILDIAKIFCNEVIKIGCVATLFAIPICYALLSSWLNGYIYRTSLSWWLFLAIPIALLALVSIIVGVQVGLTARKRPVNSLRSE